MANNVTIDKGKWYGVSGNRLLVELRDDAADAGIIAPAEAYLRNELGFVRGIGHRARDLPPGCRIGAEIMFRRYGGIFTDRRRCDPRNPEELKKLRESNTPDVERYIIINVDDLVSVIYDENEPLSEAEYAETIALVEREYDEAMTLEEIQRLQAELEEKTNQLKAKLAALETESAEKSA